MEYERQTGDADMRHPIQWRQQWETNPSLGGHLSVGAKSRRPPLMTTRNGKGKIQPNRHNARLQEGGPSPYRKSQRHLGDVKLHQTTSTLSGRQVAQLVERRTLGVDVQGSKPALNTGRWTLRRRRPHYWQSGKAKFPLKGVYIVCKKNSL